MKETGKERKTWKETEEKERRGAGKQNEEGKLPGVFKLLDLQRSRAKPLPTLFSFFFTIIFWLRLVHSFFFLTIEKVIY